MSYVIKVASGSSAYWISETICHSCNTKVCTFDEAGISVCVNYSDNLHSLPALS